MTTKILTTLEARRLKLIKQAQEKINAERKTAVRRKIEQITSKNKLIDYN